MSNQSPDRQDSIHLLKECDAGAKMAVSSIDDVLESVANEELHTLLQDSKRLHKQLGERTAQALTALCSEGKEPPLLAKGMSAMKTGMKMLTGSADQKAADLITEGCNMGVKSLCRYLNEYPAANQEAKSLANELIGEEEQLSRSMRPFL